MKYLGVHGAASEEEKRQEKFEVSSQTQSDSCVVLVVVVGWGKPDRRKKYIVQTLNKI